MTLEQINRRLHLYKKFLVYTLDKKYPLLSDYSFAFTSARRYGVNETMRIFLETGNLIHQGVDYTPRPTEPNTFDEWLMDNQHYDLVDLVQYEKDTTPQGLIDCVKRFGMTIPVDKWGCPVDEPVKVPQRTRSDLVTAMGWAIEADKRRTIYHAGADPYGIGGALSTFSIFRSRNGITEYLDRPKRENL